MMSREVPAERFERLHLVNLLPSRPIRLSLLAPPAFPFPTSPLKRLSVLQQVLALFLLIPLYPALLFLNLFLYLIRIAQAMQPHSGHSAKFPRK